MKMFDTPERLCKNCGKECMSRFYQYKTKKRVYKIFWITIDKYWLCEKCKEKEPLFYKTRLKNLVDEGLNWTSPNTAARKKIYR